MLCRCLGRPEARDAVVVSKITLIKTILSVGLARHWAWHWLWTPLCVSNFLWEVPACDSLHDNWLTDWGSGGKWHLAPHLAPQSSPPSGLFPPALIVVQLAGRSSMTVVRLLTTEHHRTIFSSFLLCPAPPPVYLVRIFTCVAWLHHYHHLDCWLLLGTKKF